MAQGGIYLFTGPDRDRKRERLEAIARALRVHLLDRHSVSAATLTAATLSGLLREHPAASPLRLIVVDDAHRLDGACVKALARWAVLLQEVACVVLLVEAPLAAEHPLHELKAHATLESFGGKDGGQAVAKPPQPFALVEAVARRDVAAALRVVHERLAEGEEVLKVLGLVVWQLQQWLTVGRLLEQGLSPERIGALTGLPSWKVRRAVSELSGRPVAWLRQRLNRCWELDAAVKSGRTIPRLALERLVVEMCLPAPRQRSVAGEAGLPALRWGDG